MIEIHHGSYRTSLLVGPLVFKFPYMLMWPKVFLSCVIACCKLRPRMASSNIRWAYVRLMAAIWQNWSEFMCWRKVRADYLALTYFSIGFITVSGRVYGEKPARDVWWAILREMSREAVEYLGRVDPHTFDPDNVRKTKDGYCFIDYGCTGGEDGGTITHFLTHWKPELEEVLCASKKRT